MTQGEAPTGHFWERTVIGWHLYFAGLLVAAAGAAVYDNTVGVAAKVTACALLAVWGAWYAVLGRRLWAEPDSRRRWLYIGGLLVCCLGASIVVPSTSLTFFVAIPQVYATIDRLRSASAVVVVLFGAYAASLGLRGAGPEVYGDLGLSAVFSVAIGAWIGGIIHQSVERAHLIAELQETREELAEVARERGALAERERLSRDIHDTVAQGFTSIVMLLEAAEPMIGADDAVVRRHLELARQAARENLAETRSLVAALTPAGLADSTLVDAVRRIAERCAEEAQLSAALTVTGSPRRLASGSEVVLLRAAQESLANVRKHAGAGRVDLTLDYAGEETVLRICDDGRGFEPEKAAGFGLNGMRARVEEAGGSLCVTSSAQGGTTVEVRVR